jgi:hypothetical protein
VGLSDVSTLGKIDVQGPDAAEFLNRVYVNGFAKLPVGKARYGVMLNDDGVLLDDGTTTRLAETRFFLTTTTAQAGEVMSWLEFLLQTAWTDLKVHVTSVTDEWAAMVVSGPKARGVLEHAFPGHDVSDAKLPYMGCLEFDLDGVPVRLIRLSFSGELAYEIYTPADYGVALDGDADRLQLVDADGRLYNGDELLYVMVADRLAQGQRVPGAVGTLMTNMAVEVALKAQDIEFVRAKVGDRYVLEELAARGWLLGGEGSGHLLALDKHTTGDGIVSALQVLQAVSRSGKSLAQLVEAVTLFPQVLVNVRLKPGQDWKSAPKLAETQAAVLRELGNDGRLLIRPSGTEPLVRVMVEARDANQARACAERLADTLRG